MVCQIQKGFRKKEHAIPSWSSSLHSDGGKLLPCAAPLPSPWSSLSHTIDIFKKAIPYNEDTHKAALKVWLPVIGFRNRIYSKQWKRDAFVTWLARGVHATTPSVLPTHSDIHISRVAPRGDPGTLQCGRGGGGGVCVWGGL